MSRKRIALGVVAAVVLAVWLAAPVVASAAEGELTGRIRRHTADTIVVVAPKKKLRLKRGEATVVDGKKKTWDELAKGDYVKVAWSGDAKPAVASHVTVLPPRKPKAEKRRAGQPNAASQKQATPAEE